jgi:G:T-mismatch repair DNA endonuclease (very short patch repair protein)/predicted RNA-binding Zn-ribbon protein involved in translation (DUF1610 family)
VAEHGEFAMLPKYHWIGWHCPPCGELIRRSKLRKTTATFLRDAKKQWGNRWNYRKVDYVDGTTPVTITCLDHGDFSIPARNHLTGTGCPRCSSGRSDIEELWLDTKGVPISDRHKKITFENGTYLFPDGLDEKTRTVYLFMGDYWHGNPAIYPRDKMHPTLKKTFGEVYNDTIRDIKKYRDGGYRVIVEWESNFTPKDRIQNEAILDPIRRIIPNPAAAIKFLETIAFPTMIICPYCGSTHIWKSEDKRGTLYCMKKECKKSFSARTGTIFHASQIRLHKWLYGIYLLKTSNRRITQKALAVRIGVGKEAARIIIDTVYRVKNRAFIERLFFEMSKALYD